MDLVAALMIISLSLSTALSFEDNVFYELLYRSIL